MLNKEESKMRLVLNFDSCAKFEFWRVDENEEDNGLKMLDSLFS